MRWLWGLNDLLRLIHKACVPWMIKAQLRLDYLPKERLEELQWRKLQALMKIAVEQTPFYRRRFKEIGAAPEDIRTAEDFAKIPLLTRDDILQHVEEMLTRPQETLRRGVSGGSTGHPLAYYYGYANKCFRLALRQRVFTWMGVKGLRPWLYLWGVSMRSNHPRVIRPWHRFAMPDFRYGIKSLNKASLAALAGDLLKIRPAVVIGYTSILYGLALYLKENGIVLAKPPQAVISTAEMLWPEHRQLLEESYRAPAFDLYGNSENLYIAAECTARTGLHVPMDHVYVEILADGGQARLGEPGYLAVTDLDNMAMPFIRYRTEDIGSWSVSTCSCGRELPMLRALCGRDTDFIFDRAGEAYPCINLEPSLRHLAADGHAIRQFQLIQTEQGHLQVLVVPGSGKESVLSDAILQALDQLFHGQMALNLRWVESIQSEPSGKTRFAKSTLPYSMNWHKS